MDAGIGYRFNRWEVRLDGYNLTKRRDAVAISELGAGQACRLSGRTGLLSASFDFRRRQCVPGGGSGTTLGTTFVFGLYLSVS